MAREITINQQNANAGAMTTLRNWIVEALQGGAVSVALRRPSKTREQEKLYHVLIGEILQQGTTAIGLAPSFEPVFIKLSDLIPRNGRDIAFEITKGLMVSRFANECKNLGEPLGAKGVTYLDPETMQFTNSRPRTKQFSVPEGSKFIEWLYANGIEMGVTWSATAQQIKMAEGLKCS